MWPSYSRGKEHLGNQHHRVLNNFFLSDCFDGKLGQLSLMEHFIDINVYFPVWLLAEKGDYCWAPKNKIITNRLNTFLHTLAFGASFKTMYNFPVGSLTKTWPSTWNRKNHTATFFFLPKEHGNEFQAEASKCTIIQTVRDEDVETVLFCSSHKLCNHHNLMDRKETTWIKHFAG